RTVMAAAGAAMALCAVAAPSAQRHAEAVLLDYQTAKLDEGIYAFIAPESKTPFVSGNSLAVIGSDGVLVVDSTNVPSLARKMIAEVKRLTDKPVRFV